MPPSAVTPRTSHRRVTATAEGDEDSIVTLFGAAMARTERSGRSMARACVCVCTAAGEAVKALAIVTVAARSVSDIIVSVEGG